MPITFEPIRVHGWGSVAPGPVLCVLWSAWSDYIHCALESGLGWVAVNEIWNPACSLCVARHCAIATRPDR